MNKKAIIITTIILVLLIAGIIVIYPKNPATPGKLDEFAKCLRDKGVTMYGAYWCSHCQNEKKAFGDSFKFVPYVECTEDSQKCISAGVQNYPTWTFPAGRKFEGEQGLQKLSQISDCPLPQSQ
jgi:hypothetical protein